MMKLNSHGINSPDPMNPNSLPGSPDRFGRHNDMADDMTVAMAKAWLLTHLLAQ